MNGHSVTAAEIAASGNLSGRCLQLLQLPLLLRILLGQQLQLLAEARHGAEGTVTAHLQQLLLKLHQRGQHTPGSGPAGRNMRQPRLPCPARCVQHLPVHCLDQGLLQELAERWQCIPRPHQQLDQLVECWRIWDELVNAVLPVVLSNAQEASLLLRIKVAATTAADAATAAWGAD
jgi:hypothetical protein